MNMENKPVSHWSGSHQPPWGLRNPQVSTPQAGIVSTCHHDATMPSIFFLNMASGGSKLRTHAYRTSMLLLMELPLQAGHQFLHG